MSAVVVNKAYKHPLRPTAEQNTQFYQWVGCRRLIYNLALEQRKIAYKKSSYAPITLYSPTQDKEVTELKQYCRENNDWAFLLDVPAVIYQQALRDLDKAFVLFFQGHNGFPKPARKGRSESFRLPNAKDIKTNDVAHPGQVRLPKMGWVRITNAWSRLGDNRLYEGALKNTTVKLEADGWYIVFVCEVVIPDPPLFLPDTPLGIDLGIANSVVTSEGEVLHIPVITKRECKKLAALQASISRKQRGSNNHKKAKARLARKHQHLTRRKRDYQHKFTTRFTRTEQCSIIIGENLSIKNMMGSAKGTVEQPGKNVVQKAGLNREIGNQGWGITLGFLAYKSHWYGNYHDKVNPSYTSLLCEICGHVEKGNRPTQAAFKCLNPECGHEINADLNAARNILTRGLVKLKEENLLTNEQRANLKREQVRERAVKREEKAAALAIQNEKRAAKRALKATAQQALLTQVGPVPTTETDQSTSKSSLNNHNNQRAKALGSAGIVEARASHSPQACEVSLSVMNNKKQREWDTHSGQESIPSTRTTKPNTTKRKTMPRQNSA